MNDRLDELLKLTSAPNPLKPTKNGQFEASKQTYHEDVMYDERSQLLSPESSTTDSDSSPIKGFPGMISTEDDIDSMQNFNKRVNSIKYLLRQISYNLDNLSRLKHLIIHSVSPTKERNYSSRLENLIEETQKLISQAQYTLGMTKKDHNEYTHNLGQNSFHSELQMRQNIMFGLFKKFKDCVQEFRVFQAEYKHQIRDKAIRQIKIVNPTIKDSDIHLILEKGDGSIQRVLKDSSIGDTDFQDLIAKSKDIKKIETNVQQLHQLFIEVAECVEQQDEAIDHIEISVNRNQEISEKANLELEEASLKRESQRKRMLILTCSLIIISIFLLTRTFSHILPLLKI